MRARRIAGCARCEHTQPLNGRGICRTCDTQLRTGECEDSLDDYPITEDTVDWVVVDRALRWVLAHDRLTKSDKVDNMATRPTMTRAERAEVFEHAARHLPPWTAATYLGIGWKVTKKHLDTAGSAAA